MDELRYIPGRRAVRRRSFLLGAGSLGLALAGGAYIGFGRKTRGKQEVTLQYDWLMSASQLGDVVAREKGFFEAEGIWAEFASGGPNAQTVPAVLSGHAQLGQLTSAQALSAFAANRPVKIFACGYQYFPYSLFSLPSRPVRTPRDLIGRSVGVNASVGATLKRILASEGIRPDQVRAVTVGADMSPILTGQVDAVGAFATNMKALAVLGPDRIEMESRKFGLHGYANVYWTPADEYDARRETLVRFTRALSRGWGWAFHNRTSAINLLCDKYPLLDRASEHASVDKVMEISFNETTRQRGWGWFDEARIADEISSFQNATGAFPGRLPNPSDYTTHDILQATSTARPRLG